LKNTVNILNSPQLVDPIFNIVSTGVVVMRLLNLVEYAAFSSWVISNASSISTYDPLVIGTQRFLSYGEKKGGIVGVAR
jgi:hypothetical protein